MAADVSFIIVEDVDDEDDAAADVSFIIVEDVDDEDDASISPSSASVLTSKSAVSSLLR